MLASDGPTGLCARCLLLLGLEQAQGPADTPLSESEPALRKSAGEPPQPPPAQGSAGGVPVTPALSEKPGDEIRGYKLLEQIGHGGFGVVYLAEQKEPVKRRVALKVIKLGMDTKQVVARFESERQALALMDHPNIAKILEAGATDTGRPYFVMELVGGINITDYCDQNRLTTRQRLDLFIQVCRAVQHAHQKGVIHRDIKPSNVLVATQDGVPIPKVIDFGIAKATQGRLTDQTVFTAFEQFLGTPAYMSPEQAQVGGLDVDTRSDIYSLGVLLYELLTGKTPFDTKELLAAGLEAMRRTIQEKEPLTPSTRLKQELTAQPGGGSTKSKIANRKPQIANDLDWIVMKCLEKDRARRYDTANGLAMDIERHVNNEPVVAGAPSRMYRFQKFVRRNKVASISTAAVALVLVLGVVVSTWQAVRATLAEREQIRLRQQAQTEADKSQQVAQFLKDMLKGVDVSVALGRDRTMLKEILDKTAERISKDLTNQPEVEADLGYTIACVYQELVQREQAEAMHRKVLTLRRKLFGDEDARVAASLTELALALLNQNKKAEAEQMAREALSIQRRIHSSDNQAIADSVNILGLALIDRGKLAEAETMLRQALAIQRQSLGESSKVAALLHTLALTLADEEKLEESESLHREALEMFRKLGIVNPHVHYLLRTLADVQIEENKLSEAETTLRERLALARKLWREGDKDVLNSLMDLAQVLREQGRLPEAEALDVEWLQSARARLPADDPDLADAVAPRVHALLIQEKFSEAEPLARECLAIGEKKRPDNYLTFYSRSLLGACLLGQKKYAEAEPLLLSAYEGMKKRQDTIPVSRRPRLKETIQRLVKLYENTERFDQLAQWKAELTQFYVIQAKCYREGAEAGDVQALNNIARLLATCEDSAVRDGAAAMAYAEKAVAATNRKNPGILDTLAAAYAEAGQFAKAVSVQNEAIGLGRDGKIKSDLAARLKLYESNTPYRAP
jgi:serine/threonine protein kinase/tetratricopeptide (TPR) repeat protein